MELSAILALSMQRNASDIILTVGRPPMFRINGSLVPDTSGVFSSEDTEKLIFSVLNDSKVKEFNEKNELFPIFVICQAV